MWFLQDSRGLLASPSVVLKKATHGYSNSAGPLSIGLAKSLTQVPMEMYNDYFVFHLKSYQVTKDDSNNLEGALVMTLF